MQNALWLFKASALIQWSEYSSSTCKLLRWNCLCLSPVCMSDQISFFLRTHTCVWKYAPLAVLSFLLCFCSLLWCFSFPVGDPRSLGIIVSCMSDYYMSCRNKRDYSPCVACLHICVCACKQFSQVLLCTQLSCYSPVVTLHCCYWFIFSLFVFVIPEDNMKSSHDTWSAAAMLLLFWSLLLYSTYIDTKWLTV